MSASLRNELTTRSAVHAEFAIAAHGDAEGHRENQVVEHPAVKHHPDSDRPALFLSASTTDHLVGLSEERSRQLLADALSHAYQDRFIYSHTWASHEFVVWDNIGLQHRRDTPTPGLVRTLFRFPGVTE